MKTLFCALLASAALASASAEEAWPADFATQLAAHVAANWNATVRSPSASVALDAADCVRTPCTFGTEVSPFDSYTWRLLASCPSTLISTEPHWGFLILK